ncbi:MAG: hypothetical protein ACTSUG_00535, partial [Candidatus Helarchaeota archaeon]
IIFLLVFFILGIPFTKWSFWVDGPGLIWHSQINNWKDLFNFFIDGGMTTLYNPSNYVVPRQSFFTVRYVPFYYVFLAFQNLFFGFSAYGYFLITIFLHAINSVILFNVFYLFGNTSLAFMGGMYFAFHPSLCTWLGWIATQYYHLELLFLLLILIFLKKYLDTKNLFVYFFTCLLYLLCLFTKELLIVLPIWLLLAVYLYISYKDRVGNKFGDKVLYSFKVTLGFWFVCLFVGEVLLLSCKLGKVVRA